MRSGRTYWVLFGVIPGPRPGVQVAQFLDRFLDDVDRVARLLLDRRQPVLADVVDVVGDQGLEDLAERGLGGELEEQALLQVPGPDPGRVEPLDEPEGFLGVLDRGRPRRSRGRGRTGWG